jgi:hypothetical protein
VRNTGKGEEVYDLAFEVLVTVSMRAISVPGLSLQ